MKYFASRLAGLIFVLLAVSFLTFLLVDLLPGDPIEIRLGPNSADPELRAAAEAELGLDRNVVVRYGEWLGDAVTGDFGTSYINQRPINDILMEAVPSSTRLVIQSMILAVLISVPLALVAAATAGSRFDKIVTGLASAVLSVPNFALAVLLGYFFGVRYQWFDVIYESSGGFVEKTISLMLPSLALALGLAAVYVRVLRTDLVTTLQEDFVVAARAMGLPEWEVMLRHALRPSSLTLLTIMAINLGALLGGALVVEIIFLVPGLGSLVTKSLFQNDYLVIQAVVLIIATVFVVANTLVDLVYGWLDPRVRNG